MPTPAKLSPLSPGQESLVLSEEVRKAVHQETRRHPRFLLARGGRSLFVLEAWVAVVRSVRKYDPALYPGVPFGAYARRHIRWGQAKLTAELLRQLPLSRTIENRHLDPEDYRRADPDPALHAWCSPDYRRQRQCLDIRTRVVLYLRCVEGWTNTEVGRALGMSRSRANQLEMAAVWKLAQWRMRQKRGRVRT